MPAVDGDVGTARVQCGPVEAAEHGASVAAVGVIGAGGVLGAAAAPGVADADRTVGVAAGVDVTDGDSVAILGAAIGDRCVRWWFLQDNLFSNDRIGAVVDLLAVADPVAVGVVAEGIGTVDE
jgi:hypothetical protein